MTPPRHTLLHITPASSTAPLTPQQKKFNSHMKRIAAQRQWLTDWELAEQAYRTRHDAELRPLLESVRQRHADLVRVLDAAHDRKGLSKAQRATLSEALADRVIDLIDGADGEAEHAELKAIYNRHASSDYDTDLAEGEKAGEAMARQMAEEILGVDLEGVDLQDEEALMRHLQAHHAREQQRQAAQAGQRRPRKPTARERKEQEAAEQASQSVREIYRKLASSLHPDRETDPAERERKTALMQRANQAYASDNLMELLQLQLEAEQIDPARIAGLGEERLKHYNRVLAGQLDELRDQVEMAQQRFCDEFGYSLLTQPKPASLMGLLREQLQLLRYESFQLERQIRALRDDPQALKPWLKAEQQRLRESEEAFDPWF